MKITPGWPESAEVLVVRKEQVVPVSPKSHVPLSTRSSQAQSNEINERIRNARRYFESDALQFGMKTVEANPDIH